MTNKLSITGFAIAGAILWGLGMLLVTLANEISPGYASEFLAAMSSIYPGFTPGMGAKSVIVGTLYGIVDAGICAAIFAWIYNCFAK